MSAAHDLDVAAEREDRLERQRAARAEARREPVFELVDELPEDTRGGGRPVNPARVELADAARRHPGRWVRYRWDDREKTKHPGKAIQQCVSKQQRPFDTEGFEAAMRGEDVYVRFIAGGDEA